LRRVQPKRAWIAQLEALAVELAAVAADESIAVAQGRMPVCWARKR